MATTWILVANASHAKIFSSQQVGHEMQLLDEFEHPESREKSVDIASDRLGLQHSQQGSGTMVESSDPKEYEARRFAHAIAEKLDKARNQNKFDDLVIVASPHFHGLLNQYCADQLKPLIKKHIPKDYTAITDLELQAHLLEAIRKHW